MSRSKVLIVGLSLAVIGLSACPGLVEGHQALVRQKRIVGGHVPQYKDRYNHIASIQSNETGAFSHICGGSHLGSGWILTAAHCLFNRDMRTIRIRLGVDNLTSASPPNDLYAVTFMRLHEHFNNFVMTNDIALLKVESVPSGQLVYYRFPDRHFNMYSIQSCEISGFGSTGFNRPLSDQFQVAAIKIVPLWKCLAKLGFIVLPSRSNSVLCVGGESADSCQGDSGSGMLCTTHSQERILLGITSFGRDCGLRGVPAIYTNVHYHLGWIRSTVLNQKSLYNT